MRKTLLYVIILAVLGVGIYYFLFNKKASLYDRSEAAFNIKDTGNIGKIFIASPNGITATVERTDSGWMVNKQYKALPTTIKNVLTTLYQQEALAPVTSAAHDLVIKSLATEGIKVEVYDRKGSKMTTFYVGGEATNNMGTNMLTEGATQPYIVQIQNFNGYLTTRYTTNIRDWRDRTVFDVPADQIKEVSVVYTDKPINSFTLKQDNGKISFDADKAIAGNTPKLNMRKANVYLKYFTNLNCEGYINGAPNLDSMIKNTKKHSAIDLTTVKGQHQHLDIYWLPLNRRSKNTLTSDPDVPDEYDADRLYAIMNDNKDTVMIQRYVFSKLFRNAYEFYEADDSTGRTHVSDEQPRNFMIHHKPQ